MTSPPLLNESAIMWGATDRMLVHGCPRCGQTHDLSWYRFGSPVPDARGNVEYTHWSHCPVSGDPVMIRVDDLAIRLDSLRGALKDYTKGKLSLLGMETQIGWWG